MEYLSLLKGIISADDGHNTYLSALGEHRSFQSNGGGKEIDETVQLITSLLVKQNTRTTGLILLKSFLQQCSIEVLEQKGTIWMTNILKASNSDQQLVYNILGCIAEKSHVLTYFSTNYLPKVYEILVNASDEALLPAVRSIEICLRLYPGPSAQSRSLIEKFITRFIDSPSEQLSFGIGRCYLLLQQVRGGSVHGQSQKALWESLQVKLIGSLHAVLDSTFEKCTELYESTGSQSEKLDAPAIDLSGEPVTRARQLYIRFRNLTSYLIVTLCDAFPVEKCIKPKKILDLISRGLSVTSTVLQRTSISDNIAVAVLLPKFHFHLLQLLQALIHMLGSHLKIHHVTVLGLLTEALKITLSKKSNGITKPLINLRIKAYELIKLWSFSMGNGSRCELYMDFFVEQIMSDIQPYQTEFTLKVLSGARKHMSKKARRQLHKAKNDQSNLSQMFSNENMRKENLSDEGNQTLCIAALSCLSALLQSCSYCMKPTSMKALQIKLLEISGTFYELPMKRHHLYFAADCRNEIFNVLYKLVEVPHQYCPPPAQLIFNILQNAHVRDSNMQVRLNCSNLIQRIEKIIHPSKEGLLFPINLRQIRNELSDYAPEDVFVQKTVSNERIESDIGDESHAEDTDDDNVVETLKSVDNTKEATQENEYVKQDYSKEVHESEESNETQEAELQVLDSAEMNVLKPPNVQITQMESCKRVGMESVVENDLSGPKLKIQKLSNDHTPSEAKASTEPLNVKTDTTNIDDDLLLADIEAAFVDELN